MTTINKTIITPSKPEKPEYMEKIGGRYDLWATKTFSAPTEEALKSAMKKEYDRLSAQGYKGVTQPGSGNGTCNSPDNKVCVVFDMVGFPIRKEAGKFEGYVHTYVRADIFPFYTENTQ